MDALRPKYTQNVIDRSTDTQSVDSKWVIEIKPCAQGPIHKFIPQLVANGFSQIQG
jgi:hypothetical protein